jgi:TonB family protein
VAIGFVVEGGVIVTSYDVIKDAVTIEARLPGEEKKTASLFAVDRHRSVALLKVEEWAVNPVALAEAGPLSPGDPVYVAITAESAQPASRGAVIGELVSVRGVRYPSIRGSAVQSSTGSPVLDRRGNVVGILGMTGDNGAISFVVPVSSIANLLNPSVASGGVTGGLPGGVVGGVPGGTPGSPAGGIIGGIPAADRTNSVSVGQGPASGDTGPKVIRKSGGVLQGTAIRRVEPIYPPLAWVARVSGAVVVEVTIDEEGYVISATPVSGHPLLKEGATAAAMGWKFWPTKLQGVPVKVIGTITFNFQM